MARTTAAVFAGVLAWFALLEIVFRLLPVSTASLTGYFIDPNILTYAPHHRWQMATGWDLRNPQVLRANESGFVSTRDFTRDPRAVAMIGDSYIEASMLPVEERPGTQLELALDGSRPVYAMGSPGTALLDYGERVRYAAQRFGVRDIVVFMEERDVEQALCGSGNVHSVCLDPKTLQRRNERLPSPSAAKQLLRHSALAQYLVSQLKIEPRRLLAEAFERQTPHAPVAVAPAAAPTAPADARAEQLADAVAAEFLRMTRPFVAGRGVLVVDTDRLRIQAGQPTRAVSRERFMQRMREAGWEVVDMAPLYRAHFAHSSLSLSVGPYDGHLNALGVRLVAQAAADGLARLAP